MGSQGPKICLCGHWRLWSDWADAQAELSLRWAHSHFVGFVTSRLRCLFVGTWCTPADHLVELQLDNEKFQEDSNFKYQLKVILIPVGPELHTLHGASQSVEKSNVHVHRYDPS